ncbi:MAG: 3-dehydroquinate synthase [Pirellulaceae bacterium]|nr:3-dehydroquinate synthase [Pirellulaceae bacterium]
MTIRVELSERSYDIRIGRGILDQAGSFVTERLKGKHAVVITDTNVRQPHAERVASSLSFSGIRSETLVVPAGEETKSAEQAAALWNRLVELGADRKTFVVAVGGGVVGDLAGFVAATYARGIPFVQVPTSLMAQVDSSVGGKVGINLPLAKNLVGAFWQPVGVLIDLDVLDTLPEREYRSGLAEVVKYGVILDDEFFKYLETHVAEINARDGATLVHLVRRSCELKAQVVAADEHEETGLRAVLNYGHTFCHAIETVSGYGTFLHGEAVAIGMICASRLAELVGRVESDLTARQVKLLASLGLPTALSGLDIEALMATMQRDKKAEQGALRFVLPSRLGSVELVGNIDAGLVRRAWQS